MSKKSIDRIMSRLSPSTKNGYSVTIKKYEEYHGTSIEELIDEALEEQTNQVPFHQLKVIDRLEDFQDYLIEQDYVHGTISTYITRLKTLYKRFNVVLPNIEPINPKRTRRREYIEYKDILTKEELKLAIKEMKAPAQARVMAMIQGGLSNEECEHLTTRCFIDTTFKYHQCDDDINALKWLADENHPIIWVVKLIRQKTKKPYYCLIGSEAVNYIAKAKLYELKLPKNKGEIPDKLLTNHKISFNRICREVNEKLGFGLVAEESKLRPHNFRRFHATYIGGSALSYEENSLISNSEIDEMQGRGKTSVQDTYIKSNPIRQKLLYAKVMNNLSLFHQYDYEIIDDDVRVFIVDTLKENEELKKENKKLNNIIKKREKSSAELNKLRNELGEDTFREMIYGILNAS